MGFTQSAQQIQDQISHKAEILRLIKRTNDAIAEFDEVPTLINPYTKQTTYIEQAQRGKKVSLAVQILLLNSRSILPLKFFQNLKVENRYKKAFQKPYLFLAEEATQQYEGIVNILYFYQMLLDAIYSLPDFSDVLMMNTKKDKRKQELSEDEEDIKKIKEANMEASIDQKWKNLGIWTARVSIVVVLAFLGLGFYGILKSCNTPDTSPKAPMVVTQCMVRGSNGYFYLQQQNAVGKEITELKVDSIEQGIALAAKMDCPLVNKAKKEPEPTVIQGPPNAE